MEIFFVDYNVTILWPQVNNFLIHQSTSSNPMTVEEVAMGFIRVANESMCRPIRSLTQVNVYFKVKFV